MTIHTYKPGDKVRVRPLAEIKATLQDDAGPSDINWNDRMEECCGHVYVIDDVQSGWVYVKGQVWSFDFAWITPADALPESRGTTHHELHAKHLEAEAAHETPKQGWIQKTPSDEKPHWDRMPWAEVELVRKVMDYGDRKYKPDNWQHIELPKEQFFAAAMRHLIAHKKGEKTDESGFSHLAHAAASILFLMWHERNS